MDVAGGLALKVGCEVCVTVTESNNQGKKMKDELKRQERTQQSPYRMSNFKVSKETRMKVSQPPCERKCNN